MLEAVIFGGIGGALCIVLGAVFLLRRARKRRRSLHVKPLALDESPRAADSVDSSPLEKGEVVAQREQASSHSVPPPSRSAAVGSSSRDGQLNTMQEALQHSEFGATVLDTMRDRRQRGPQKLPYHLLPCCR